MSELDKKIRDTLGELHDELQSIDSMQPETRQELEDAVKDIHRALESQEFQPSDLTDHPGPGLLRSAIVQFELSHPKLAGAMERVIDTLTQMGI